MKCFFLSWSHACFCGLPFILSYPVPFSCGCFGVKVKWDCWQILFTWPSSRAMLGSLWFQVLLAEGFMCKEMYLLTVIQCWTENSLLSITSYMTWWGWLDKIPAMMEIRRVMWSLAGYNSVPGVAGAWLRKWWSDQSRKECVTYSRRLIFMFLQVRFIM